mgnify:CR=1 FL=1
MSKIIKCVFFTVEEFKNINKKLIISPHPVENKIFWENYSECLHCPNLHPELSDLVPIYGRRLVDIKDDPNWKRFTHHDDPKYKGGMKKGTETWSMNGSAQGHRVEYLENQTDFPGYIYMTTWPSMFLAIFTDHIRMVRILPLSEELTEVTAEWVFRKETLKDKKYSMKNNKKVKNYYVKESVGIATGILISCLHYAGLSMLTHTPSPMNFLNQILKRPINEKPFVLLVVGKPKDDCEIPVYAEKKKTFSKITSIF